MRKYFYVLKTEFKNNTQYLFDLLVGTISYGVIIYVYFNLWTYLYSDGENLINGYTSGQMIWYILFTEVIWLCLKGRKVVAEISNDVKSGNITYQLNKPYSYVNYMLAKTLGDGVFKFFLYLPISFMLGFILIGPLPGFRPLTFVLAIFGGLLAAFVSILIFIFIGLIAFFIEDANPIYWVYSKVILVIGTLFPIEFFPQAIQPFLYYSPIYAIAYGPAKLLVDFSVDTLYKVVLSNVVYFVIFYILSNLLYKKGVKKINVNGG